MLVDVREREEVELELQVPLAQVSQQQKESVVRQLAALLHVLDADITMKGLHDQSDIRYKKILFYCSKKYAVLYIFFVHILIDYCNIFCSIEVSLVQLVFNVRR